MRERSICQKMPSFWLIIILFTAIFFSAATDVSAQYFGQNKVRYKNLKFKVYETPHFDLYYYLKNDSLVQRFAKEAEVWYELHQQVFRDTFLKKNPFILYSNHPDFQQTTALMGEISVGTGGVTEGMKNRVIMPISQLNHQTRHVLGHELVHAFQYHSLIEGDSTNLENIGNLPLWMVEGMAEYLSVGKQDAYTSMWMRDAYLNKDIPSLRDLTTSNKYFPYRYGQAFWSYIGSTYGDTVIVPFFKETAKYGYEMAIRRTFGYDERTLSSLWKTSVENTYRPYLKDTAQTPIGKKIIDDKNGGATYNLAPAISPDGNYVAFLSERDLLSIDLFLADAKTGKILKKLSSKAKSGHIDEYNFIESAGAWSPDSKKFAFSAFSAGVTKLLVVDASSGRVISTEGMGNVEEFSNITWSPNGNDVAFSGLKEGQNDLYQFNLNTKVLTQLTNDKYSEYHPSYSRDGRTIVFSSDRTTYDQSAVGVDITMNMAVIDIATKSITDLHVFDGANNLNPQFSSDNKSIFFLSNRDGFRNLYRYSLEEKTVEQLTDYFTGISGITEYSPALSVSNNDDILYSYYRAQKYTIYNAKIADFKAKNVGVQELNFDAAALPPAKSVGVNIINANLNNFERFERIPKDSIRTIAYKPKFKLDYLSSNGVGASVGRFGTGLASGIQGVFSDILGRNQIFATAAVNGEIYDFGGQVAYVNQQSRINWGAVGSHIPYVSGQVSAAVENIPGVGQTYIENYDIIRTFEDQFSVFASYPFSRNHRFEAGSGISRYSYRIDRYSNYYDYNSGYPIGNDRKKLSRDDAAAFYGVFFDPFTTVQLNAAFVGDNSYSGMTGPLDGFRYRLGIENYQGDYKLNAITADVRRYVRLKPITVAGRIYTYTRMGRDENRLYQMYAGYGYLIRGYDANSFYRNGTTSTGAGEFDINQLVGSRIAVANFELRLPFTGPEKLAAVESKFLFSDLNLFFDMGLAYDNDSKVAFRSSPRTINGYMERIPAMSAGVSLRVNVFGYFILEPYYAIPFQRKDVKTGIFGLTFAPGW
ncbi:MAG: tolB protein precursor [Sphingobacteriales bacterium 17-39-43]|uniref:DPP IV N-terminal domain-containing protein n=2 Tax=Daejeonella sp. TaxID=2805397 RepID=UPI000BDC521D|nr:DPP IV N-terminal domain-containing protein [Daejeonella sp.]OYZ29824.1 MAG: tolB protein precursor [Sphingobacteriales bacterium 16-39-50]OZA22702.1 MAG: tolB protein precursor [Sphingobacteriales bacterium 17-39-43]HQT59150.1 DPP IV N-terminal domain-containing protein [Daejeonella sp.]